MVTVERLNIRQRTVLTRKARRKRTLKTNPTKKRHRNLKRMVVEGARQIGKNLNATIAEKWIIWLGTARNLAKVPILLEKVSRIETSEN